MREILFRGKDKDGYWIEGGLIPKTDYDAGITDYFIYDVGQNSYDCWRNSELVIPETVGQYTGLNDKNGEKIFEGDIVKFENDPFKWRVVFGMNYGYGINSPGFMLKDFREAASAFRTNEMEVIGNIHDNPELLKVEND